MFATYKRNLIALSALFVVAASTIAKPVPSDGLVLDFRNGPDTLKLKDSSSSKNSGRATSVVIPTNPSLVSMQTTHQLTLSLWIKPRSIPSEFPTLISKGAHNSSNTNAGYELTLNANGDNDILFYSGTFEARAANANGSLVNHHLGEWIHIAVTIDATAQTAQIYVNGQPYQNVVTFGNFSDINFDTPYDLYVGTKDPGAAPSFCTFDGTLRQVLIYNRVLSAQEVQNMFSTTLPK